MVSRVVSVTSLVALVTVLRAVAAQPPGIFVPVQEVGSLGGSPAVLYGCSDTGATVSSLKVWSTANFIRGMQVFLSDGRNNLFGCVNSTLPTGPFIGCLDADIRDATFDFAPGETITALNAWPGSYTGSSSQSESDRTRAGALAFTTSMGRSFDFGMTAQRPAPTAVSVGSGILCGVSQHSGADINSVGFVFLEPATTSLLGNVSYTGVPAAQVDINGLQAQISDISVANATLDNSMNSTWHTYGYQEPMQQQQYANWSRAPGLDSILTSNMDAGVPMLALSSDNRNLQGWTVAPATAQPRLVQGSVSVDWSYNVSVPGGGIDAITVSTRQATLANVLYTANLTVQLSTGASFSVPVQGLFGGITYTPIVVDTAVVKAAPPPPPASAATQAGTLSPSTSQAQSGQGGSTNTVAIVLGVLLGVLACLALVAILLLLAARRRKRACEEDSEAAGSASSSQGHPSALGYILPWGVGRKNSRGAGSRKGQRSVDPSEFGLPDAKLSEQDVHGARALPEPHDNPKADALAGASPGPEAAAAAAAAAADREGAVPAKETVPYSLYRSLRLDSIRTALGLGRRPADPAEPAKQASIELNDAQPTSKSDTAPHKVASMGADKPDTTRQPPSPVTGVHWGYPVDTPHPEDPPLKSAFHQSCDPVLPADSNYARDAKPSLDKTPSLADDPEELSQGPPASSRAPDSPKGGLVAPSGLSRLSPTPSGSDEYYVEPKYLRPGFEDDDNLLVDPTHRRIKGFGSKPAPDVVVDDRKGKRTVEHEETTIRLGDRSRSSQQDPAKRIVVEDTPVTLGSKYHAPDTKSTVGFEGAELKLGAGYQTQGRNE